METYMANREEEMRLEQEQHDINKNEMEAHKNIA